MEKVFQSDSAFVLGRRPDGTAPGAGGATMAQKPCWEGWQFSDDGCIC